MATILKGPWGKRPARSQLWAALWPELAATPSPGQETVIAELVMEISGLARKLGLEQPGEPAAWLRGFAHQLDQDLWPPTDSKAYQRLLAGLKARKRQLEGEARRADRVTPAQIKAIWAIVHRDPHLDEDLLYQIVGRDFPRAVKSEAGTSRPSLSRLTCHEASRLIDTLGGGRRRRA